jgi:hypothetical protein
LAFILLGLLIVLFSSCPNGCNTGITVKSLVDKQFYLDTFRNEFYQILRDKKLKKNNEHSLILIAKPNYETQFSVLPPLPNIIRTSTYLLNAYETIDYKSLSATPGSVVFPPSYLQREHKALKGLSKAIAIKSQGNDVSLIELRGWLRSVATGCNNEGNGAHWHYHLELDLEWAENAGFTTLDIHKIIRVGSIIESKSVYDATKYDNAVYSPSEDFFKVISLPLIKIELNSYGWKDRLPGPRPMDWNITIIIAVICFGLFVQL